MAAAEGAAKGLVSGKVSAENPSLEFSDQESYSLAHWALLKIIVAAKALGNDKFTLDPGVYYDIRRGRIPHGFVVELALASSIELNSYFGPVTVWKAKEDDKAFIGELAAHSFIGCYQAGRLMFRASHVQHHERVTRVRMAYPTTILHPFAAELPFEANHSKGEGQLELPMFGVTLGICMDYHLTREGKKFFRCV